MGVIDVKQYVRGVTSKILHEILGDTYNYTCIIDQSASPKTTLTFSGISMKPTAEVRGEERIGGLSVEKPLQSGNWGTEQNPFFFISRETLKADGVMMDSLGATPAAGTYYEPQIGDYFSPTSDSTVVYTVTQIFPDGSLPGFWQLQFTRHIRIAAHGVSNV